MLTKILFCIILGTVLTVLVVEATTCVGDFIKDADTRVWSTKSIRLMKVNYATCVESFNYWDDPPEGDCEVELCAYTCLAHCVADAVSILMNYHLWLIFTKKKFFSSLMTAIVPILSNTRIGFTIQF